MKTTFDIPEPLLRDVQTLARERKTTTKSLVEEALRRLLDEHVAARQAFTLRDASFKRAVPGRVGAYEQMTWEQQRDLMYGLDK
jgi:hypothetical protein